MRKPIRLTQAASMPEISMNRNTQKPSALWRSQLKRFHPTPSFTPRLRFQRPMPGHHIDRSHLIADGQRPVTMAGME